MHISSSSHQGCAITSYSAKLPSFSCYPFIFIIPFILPQVSSSTTNDNYGNIFTSNLFDKYSTNGRMTAKQLNILLLQVRGKYIKNVLNEFELIQEEYLYENNTVDIRKSCSLENATGLPACLRKRCLSGYDAFNLYNISTNESINVSQFLLFGPMILSEAGKTHCDQQHDLSIEYSSARVWGYGFLFVTIINICSLGGALIFPFMKKSVYKQMMTFLVGLAVGSLAATGLTVLIPEALHLFTPGHSRGPVIIKAIAIFAGIYLFFLIERFLKILMLIRQKNCRDKNDQSVPEIDNTLNQLHSSHHHHSYHHDHHMDDLNFSIKANNVVNCKDVTAINSSGDAITNGLLPNHCMDRGEDGASCTSVDVTSSRNQVTLDTYNKPLADMKPKQIASIAWMIIFGDGLHNFIDGLSIGAAFTQSTLTGISVSLAVICEEIPHELGDFAVLVRAGMTIKQAMLFNLLSACSCYLGLIGGIVLGENTLAHEWIFALAGGMFLYISLVDMLPEMNSSAEEEEQEKNIVCSVPVFFLQNAGIISGFTVIAIMTLYAEAIEFH